MAKQRASKTIDPASYLPPGPPTMYRPEFCQQLVDFFSVEHFREVEMVHEKTGNTYIKQVPNKLPTLSGFAASIGVSSATVQKWARNRPEFAEASNRAKTLGEDMLVSNTLLGLYNPTFAAFVAKNYTGMRDVQEIRDVTEGDQPETPDEIDKRIAELDKEILELQAQL